MKIPPRLLRIFVVLIPGVLVGSCFVVVLNRPGVVSLLKKTMKTLSWYIQVRGQPHPPYAAATGPLAARQPDGVNVATKRAFDIVMSGTALVMLAPLFLIIGSIIRLTSPGPVFYLASRVGQYGRIFKMFKFRTMVVNADKMGPGITTRNDKRITPIGRVLRMTKLDELPQLINVLLGDMSLVGPRPEDPRYVQHYRGDQVAILAVRPGITSPASVHFRDEENLLVGVDWESHYLSEILPKKLSLDLEYARHPSIGRDIGVIFQTFQAIRR